MVDENKKEIFGRLAEVAEALYAGNTLEEIFGAAAKNITKKVCYIYPEETAPPWMGAGMPTVLPPVKNVEELDSVLLSLFDSLGGYRTNWIHFSEIALADLDGYGPFSYTVTVQHFWAEHDERIHELSERLFEKGFVANIEVILKCLDYDWSVFSHADVLSNKIIIRCSNLYESIMKVLWMEDAAAANAALRYRDGDAFIEVSSLLEEKLYPLDAELCC